MNALKNLFVGTLLLSTLGLSAQNSESTTFIDFGKEKISKSEFEYIYKKNNNGEMVSKSTVDEYLELYINFKLKVMEAEAMGLDTVGAFVTELDGYRTQLAQPYMTDDDVLEQLKKEAYERLQIDVRASHILVSVSSNASPEDTLAAFNKIENIKKMLEEGKDFSKVAKEYSDDPSAKTNGGDLGYFTAFYMVYPFESAAYNTEVGGISTVVRSKFGYHVLKVVDKRKAVGEITVAHILISNDVELSKTDNPEGKIDEIYEQLKEGANFSDMAAQFSDDVRSSSKGGELPTFGVSRMVPEFEEVAFALKNPGDYSKPFQTQYGWHIIKLIKKEPIGSYETIELVLASKVEKDSRSNLQDGAMYRKIKDQYGFSEVLKERDDFYIVIDSSYFSNEWQLTKANKLNKTLFTIGDAKINQSDFAKYLFTTQGGGKPIDFKLLVNRKYEKLKKAEILAYKNSKLDEEYPEFKALMQEYHDGILLFNLTDELVWSKAVNDSAGLEDFYTENKENYKWGDRVDAIVFSALNMEIAENTKALILKGDSLQLLEIVEEVNQSSQLNLKYELNKYQEGENEFIDGVEWKVGMSAMIEKDNRVIFVYIKEVLAPTYKTTKDARGVITSDYQEYLEKKWIEDLRVKYPYKVNQEVLESLKTELN